MIISHSKPGSSLRAAPLDKAGRSKEHSRRRAAFTLIELVVSMTIMTVLTLGMGSAMLLAARALPAKESVFRHRTEAATAVQQIMTELHTANSFKKICGSSMEFTVQDRDNNGTSETIFYQWPLSPGMPLTRKYNGGTATVIAENVGAFTLGYTTKASEMLNLVQEVAIVLQIGSDPAAEVRVAVQVLNQPDVALLALCPS